MRLAALVLSCLIAPALCCIAPLRARAAPVPVIAGSRAPDFTRAGFDGKPVTLSVYRGKVVLLDFWASWCAPCLEEMPDLINLQKQNGGKLQVIGVSMDDGSDAAKSITKRFSFNYPLLMGDAQFGNLYGGVLGLPEIYLISRDGKVLKRWRGDMKSGELDQAVKAAVG